MEEICNKNLNFNKLDLIPKEEFLKQSLEEFTKTLNPTKDENVKVVKYFVSYAYYTKNIFSGYQKHFGNDYLNGVSGKVSELLIKDWEKQIERKETSEDFDITCTKVSILFFTEIN